MNHAPTNQDAFLSISLLGRSRLYQLFVSKSLLNYITITLFTINHPL